VQQGQQARQEPPELQALLPLFQLGQPQPEMLGQMQASPIRALAAPLFWRSQFPKEPQGQQELPAQQAQQARRGQRVPQARRVAQGQQVLPQRLQLEQLQLVLLARLHL
jgi:hypothetical protein